MGGPGGRQPAAAPQLRVVVADDDELFLRAVGDALAALPLVEVVALARDGEEAIALAARLEPDVVLLDVAMPRCDGIEATRRIVGAGRDVCVLVVSATDDLRAFTTCLALGASGCLRKDRPLQSVAVL